jgi:hypothetical protein
MITPALTLAANVTKSLNFKAAIISSANQTKNTITVSISTDNGSTWSVLGTRFHTNATSTAMAPFDLTSYSGSTIKIKFETLDADGTIGALLDDIAITSTSNTITPALDFTSNTYSKYLTFRAGTIGTINTTYNTITVFASSDNGTTWTVLGTRTPTSATATQMTLFNLGAYNSSNQVKLKFEVLGSDGTNAAFIDDIAVVTASTMITPAIDFTATSALEFLTFKASRLNTTANTDANTVTVSASSNNGATWTVLGTRTATVTGAPTNVMTPFDLSAYESFTQVKLKFEALSTFGTTGVSLDDIAITEASTMITPTLDFSNKGVQLVYTTALVSTANTTFQQVKVSISHDNGASWSTLNTTTTAGTYTLDLSSYHSATTKIKFETPYANGTIGASLDNITFNSAAASNTNPVTSCISQSLVTGCNSTLDCANDPNPPVIIRCAPDATITDCSGNLPDYRTLLSTYDDCSVTIIQSPAPGTALAALGNGTHIITFTVSDESASSPDTTCTMVLTLSGCAGCSVKTWTGSTWSPTGTPTIANEVVIDDTYNTTNHGNIECCKLTVNSGKTLTVTSDMYAYVINEVVNNGTFTIENNGSLVQEAEGKTNTGNLIYKRITKQRNSDYVYWSSPVANYALANHITIGPKYIWNTTAPNANGTQGTWVGAPATLDLAQGVIVRGNANFNDFTTTINNYENTFTGVPNNGAVTRSVFRGNLQGSGTTSGGATITAIDDNYNLIGNPYPSSISAKDFLIENNSVLTGAIAIWTHGTLIGNNNQSFYQNFTYTYSSNNYNFYNLSGSVFSPGTDYYIGAGQGFFVTMIDDITASSGNVTFKNTMRSKNYTNSSTASTPNFFRSASNNATSTNATLSHKLWIDIVGQNGSSSRTLVAYTEGATNQKDNLFDAITKPQNDLLFYSLLDQDRLVIQGKALPFDVSDQVPMGYFAPTAGNYTLALAFVEGTFNNGQVIYVKDNLLNSYHNLSESAYTFTTVAGENQNRFVIVYQTLLNNEHFNSSQVNIIINDFIHIESKENMQNIEIYDMLGKLIKNYSNVNTTFWKESFNYANGVYLVKITTQDKTTISQKVIK